MAKPVLSVVIANFNYGRFLEDAICSVLNQGVGTALELIVCDGGSTDNSIEIIRKYADKISWWCSEHDRGQSDAFNKGFKHASGRFLTWLNADDILLPGTAKAVIDACKQNPDERWFVGGSVWMDAGTRICKCFRAHNFSHLRAKAGCLMVGGPSSFFEKSLLEEVGMVDESLHYVMDIDLWYKFYAHGVTYRRIPKFFWAFRIHEASKLSGPTLNPYSEESRRKRAELSKEQSMLRERHQYCRGRLLNMICVIISISVIDKILVRVAEKRLVGLKVLNINWELV